MLFNHVFFVVCRMRVCRKRYSSNIMNTDPTDRWLKLLMCCLCYVASVDKVQGCNEKLKYLNTWLFIWTMGLSLLWMILMCWLSSHHLAALCRPGWGTVWHSVHLPSPEWPHLPCTVLWHHPVATAVPAGCSPAHEHSQHSVSGANRLKEMLEEHIEMIMLRTPYKTSHYIKLLNLYSVFWRDTTRIHLKRAWDIIKSNAVLFSPLDFAWLWCFTHQLSCCSSPLVCFSVQPPVQVWEQVSQVQTLSPMSSLQSRGLGGSAELGDNARWLNERSSPCKKRSLPFSFGPLPLAKPKLAFVCVQKSFFLLLPPRAHPDPLLFLQPPFLKWS